MHLAKCRSLLHVKIMTGAYIIFIKTLSVKNFPGSKTAAYTPHCRYTPAPYTAATASSHSPRALSTARITSRTAPLPPFTSAT